MPFFDEKGPLCLRLARTPRLALCRRHSPIRRLRFVVAEYNSSITGALKNALDQAYKEWGRKPFTAIGYGGAERRGRSSIYAKSRVRCEWFRPHHRQHWRRRFHVDLPMGANKPIEDIEAHLLASTKSALDELVWWATRRWRRKPLKLHIGATERAAA